MAETNYFVCTLGEAAHVTGGRPFRDVNYLIEQQARNYADSPAIAFYRVGASSNKSPFAAEILNFRRVREGVLVAANRLSKRLRVGSGDTVGLLCSSSPEFLFTWLGCIRLGHPVLLVAPECSASGIAQLCQSCNVSTLLVDRKNIELGEEATKEYCKGESEELRCVEEPFRGEDVFEVIRSPVDDVSPCPSIQDTDTAYLHHTSGTSSGMPKPIPQSHRGAVGVLPSIDGRDKATFTTTPLFHGGPADIFRAWSSNAMIWLFPSKDVPITASNVLKCLTSADEAAGRRSCPAISYFASVPYVLQSMAENDEGLSWLQNMDLVGVGGAALPAEVGNRLVKEHVNLVSRFGSAECGFLLSSHRDYNKDEDWQYLRVSEHSSQLQFEDRQNDVSELVVLSDWPHRAKSNREDGSFATSDLFECHPYIKDAWKYHSRADSQLTLVTGKKFEPGALEQAIVAGTKLISDTFVFGDGRPYPGVLIFRSEKASSISDKEVIQNVWPIVEKINARSDTHATIPRHMLIPLPYSDRPLGKSSKGTILRKQAEERYGAYIASAYDQEDSAGLRVVCSDDDLPEKIKVIITRAMPSKTGLTDTTDLFAYGVDSVAGMQIRNTLQRLLPQDASHLPINIVEDCGSVQRLTEYIIKARVGQSIDSMVTQDDQHAYMLDLVNQYGRFEDLFPTPPTVNRYASFKDSGEIIVLTGGTGALGAYVLDGLRNNAGVSKIYCLVRGADEHAARQRVDKSLRQRHLPALEPSENDAKIVVLQAALGDSTLGLHHDTYTKLVRETTVILHLAWSVNFRMRLRSFIKDSISSVQNLINLALASPQTQCPRFLFCSSVASVMNCAQESVPETILSSPSVASVVGYSQSKWVAEQICNNASKHPRLCGRVSVLRVGQLSGHSKTGVWNAKEAWPMMLSTVKLTESLPDLQSQILDWLPVDIAAKAVVEATTTEHVGGDLQVFHVINENRHPTWKDLLHWLSKRASFDVVSPREWIQRLEAVASRGSDHPALQLLDHWRTAFKRNSETGIQQQSPVTFSMQNTKDALPVLRAVKPIDEVYMNKVWTWIEANMTTSPKVDQSKKYAYTTLLTRASYLAGVVVLAHTLRKHGSQYPLIVVYTPALADAAVEVLKLEADKMNLILHLCDPLLPPEHDKMPLIAQRFADTWTKLRVFELFEYDVLCYLDADMAIYNTNMDQIFAYAEDLPKDQIAANHVCCCNLDNDSWAPEDWTKANCPYTPLTHPSALAHPTSIKPSSRETYHLLNGGLLLYRPSRDLWCRMMHYFETSESLKTYMFPDQDFLADFFRGRWRPVGWQWNALKTMRYWHPEMWRDEEVTCLHYIVDKPWAARIPKEGSNAGIAGYKGNDGETHSWWWNEYAEWVDNRLSKGMDEVVNAVDKAVAPKDGSEPADPDMVAISVSRP